MLHQENERIIVMATTRPKKRTKDEKETPQGNTMTAENDRLLCFREAPGSLFPALSTVS